MSEITLHRLKDQPSGGINGVIGYIDIEGFRIYTIERPLIVDPISWPYGKKSESCVLEGNYKIVSRMSSRFKKNMPYLDNPSLGVYESFSPLKTGRAGVTIHVANTMKDLEGCIGVGSNIISMGNNDLARVSGSRNAEAFIHEYISEFNVSNIKIIKDGFL